MPAPALSPMEAAIVARFEAAEPAPESYRATTEAAEVARRFHEAYERLAPSFGYQTRRASAVPWEDVPEQNRALMVAVCAELGAAERGKADALRADVWAALDTYNGQNPRQVISRVQAVLAIADGQP